MTEPGDWKVYALTAGELRARLEGVPDDTPVILSQDAEGNGYSPLSSVETGGLVYEPESTGAGHVYDTEPDDEDDYVPQDGTPVVLLWPVN
jgi:hypothetical protein